MTFRKDPEGNEIKYLRKIRRFSKQTRPRRMQQGTPDPTLHLRSSLTVGLDLDRYALCAAWIDCPAGINPTRWSWSLAATNSAITGMGLLLEVIVAVVFAIPLILIFWPL